MLPPISADIYRALRADIAEKGLLVPLLFDAKTGQCLDGRIRLKVAEELGIPPGKIPRVWIGDLNPEEREEYRVSINTLRRHLSRAQLRVCIAWQLRKHPDWSNNAIGKSLGVSHNTVKSVRSGCQIDNLDKRRGSDGKLYPARKPMVFAVGTSTQEARKALLELGTSAPRGFNSVRRVRRLASEKRRQELEVTATVLPDDIKILNLDFRKADIRPGSVDLCLLDPPWHSPRFPRVEFAAMVNRILKPGKYAAIYTGSPHMPQWLDIMRQTGLVYRWVVSCVHAESRGSIFLNGSIYNRVRPVLVFQKGGTFKTAKLLHDFLPSTPKKEFHDWQQPLSESLEIIKSLTLPDDLVVDLTCGTGTVAVASAMLGRRFYGCEIDPRLCRVARHRVSEVLPHKLVLSVR